MVKFLNKDKAFAEIVEIVSKADSKLVLISPYIKIPDDLLERLKYKDRKGIKTTVVCREKDLGDKVRSDLRQLRNLELRFDDDLHAKCFYNEKSMVITSLNLLESSERKNREMGVLLSSEEDANVFNEALSEAEFIVNRAKKDSVIRSVLGEVVKEAKLIGDSLTKEGSRQTKTVSRTKQKGHCIRCRKSIPLALGKPYCPDCFVAWSEWENPNYKEQYCHNCGKPAPTTMLKPQCPSCFRKFYS